MPHPCICVTIRQNSVFDDSFNQLNAFIDEFGMPEANGGGLFKEFLTS